MVNLIQVKRGAFASLPTLAAGEFGFSTDTKQVHIGDGAANDELVRFGSIDISGASWVLDENDMVSNDDTKVPTQQSVKAYVDDLLNGATTEIPVGGGAGVAPVWTEALGMGAPLRAERGTNLLGVPGAAGFGVGICPPQILPDGMSPLAGYDNPASPNYGNYMYRDGSVMCWIPRFYYKISTLEVDIKGIDTYATETAANTAGYAMHRAYKDGGIDQQGFFYDKYMCSKNAWGTGQIASSLPNGLPLSTAAVHNPIADLTACAGNYYYETINAAHARDGVDGAVNTSTIFHITTMFQCAAIALLSLAHGQAASSTTNCAWYDATYNYPKGCNNDALQDYNEVSNGAGSGDDLLYVTDGYSNCGKTGSGEPFAKCTHNGQACGVADVNGLMYEINLGLVRSGTTDTEAINDALGTTKFYTLKTSVSAKSLASGWTTGAGTAGSTAWGDAAYLEGATTSYDLLDLPMIGAATGWAYFGNGANQVLDAALSGAGWIRTGLGIYLDAGSGATGTNLFGKDGLYEYHRSNLCVLSCNSWYGTSYAVVWAVNLNSYRTHTGTYVGVRAACYPE